MSAASAGRARAASSSGSSSGTSSSERNTRQRGLQGTIERQQFARHLLPHLPGVVPGLDGEVAAQQLDHREVRGGLAIGHRRRFQDQPVLRPVRVRELPHQSRFPDAGLAHDRHDLPLPLARQRERPPEQLHLRIATDEAREASRTPPRATASAPGSRPSTRRSRGAPPVPSRAPDRAPSPARNPRPAPACPG